MKLRDNVYLVGGGFMGMGISYVGDCHIYLVHDGGAGALIDAGYGFEPGQIVDNIHADGIDPDSVESLILTHCHGDHSGGAAWLKENLGLQAVVPAGTRAWLEEGDEDAINLTRARAAGRYPPDYRFQTFAVEREVGAGDRIAVGSLELEVFATPGHANPHNAFLLRDGPETFLFSGDLVFANGDVVLNFAPETSPWQLGNSLAQFRDFGLTGLFPGHHGISLKYGQQHIDAALAKFDTLTVPRNMMS